ncbi:hypothetical protein [Vreelandella nanhaiensis]|uniref:hypothetical protein n=1 Tax=Vreelandella nanhaiensis TaxID=1258546 RepID=UPI00163CFD47|nr:hypothetical protein [Halomonas nanhaiensis]
MQRREDELKVVIGREANDLESAAYIHHMLEHIATADMLETLKALLPRHVDLEAITKKVA